jgi:hypothetical protein
MEVTTGKITKAFHNYIEVVGFNTESLGGMFTMMSDEQGTWEEVSTSVYFKADESPSIIPSKIIDFFYSLKDLVQFRAKDLSISIAQSRSSDNIRLKATCSSFKPDVNDADDVSWDEIELYY